MTPHALLHGDILDTRESLKGGFWASVSLHGTLIGIAVAYALINANSTKIGDPNAGGAAVGIEIAHSIPLAHHGPQNPVANDTQSEVPQTPAPPVKREKVEAPPPDAIPLRANEQKKKPAKVASEPQRFRPYQQLDPNQITTKAAPQVSNPLYSAQSGSGLIGPGANSTLGSRCGAYAAQIIQLVSQRWNTGDVDPRVQTAPVVIATFDLARNGTASNLKLLQSSNIPALNFSVQRAITDASPFPPVPNCIDKNTVRVEFNFELKR